VGGVVVTNHVQLASRVCLGDLLEEREEFGVGVPFVAVVGDLAGGHLEGRTPQTRPCRPARTSRPRRIRRERARSNG